MLKWLFGIGAVGLIGYTSIDYLKKKQVYDDEVRKSIVTLYDADDSIIPSITKLPSNYVDTLVTIYLSNDTTKILEQANLLVSRGYVRTGNAFNTRAKQISG
jgi:hypothetical protein